jgi:hypothetical protein
MLSALATVVSSKYKELQKGLPLIALLILYSTRLLPTLATLTATSTEALSKVNVT